MNFVLLLKPHVTSFFSRAATVSSFVIFTKPWYHRRCNECCWENRGETSVHLWDALAEAETQIRHKNEQISWERFLLLSYFLSWKLHFVEIRKEDKNYQANCFSAASETCFDFNMKKLLLRFQNDFRLTFQKIALRHDDSRSKARRIDILNEEIIVFKFSVSDQMMMINELSVGEARVWRRSRRRRGKI